MVLWFRLEYNGVKGFLFDRAFIYGCAESKEELESAIERERQKPSIGKGLEPNVYYPADLETFATDATRPGVIDKVGYDESLFVRCPEVADLIDEEFRTATTNIFGLEQKMQVTKPPTPMIPPEPEKPPVERLKEEKHLTSPKPKGWEAFKQALNEKDISVLMLDTKDDADYKRIRFLSLGFRTLFFPYRDKFIVLIYIKEFDKSLLKLIRDLMKSHLKKKIDVEIGLPEIEGKPEEVLKPDTEEKAIEAIKKALSYKREILPEEVASVLKYYEPLWDNILNRCLEYDDTAKIHYPLRKDWNRTIRGISIFSRGLTRLAGHDRERDIYIFNSMSENPKERDKEYTVTIRMVEDNYVLDSDEPDRTNDVVVGITVDGKREVERFITKHMVSALILFTMG